MKAVLKTESKRGANLGKIEIPKIGSYEVLVKVKATSLCGTDVHIYEWNEWAQSRIRIPQVLGHEFAGEVVEVGTNVKNIKIGDYISAETHIPCDNCPQCLQGQRHICTNLKILGVDCNGSFAEYIAIPEKVVWKNDPAIPPEIASVQEPLGNAVYCTLIEPVTGKTVLILGDGPTALFATGVSQVAGASRIFVVGIEEARLEIAKRMGADIVIHAEREDVEEIILDSTNGIGVDVVLEMVGVQETINQGFRLVRKGGRYCAFGIASGKVVWDMTNGVVFKGVTIYGINGRLIFDTWIKVSNLLLSGKLDIRPIITHRFPLEQFEKGFELMTKRPKICGKIVFFP
jgi:threonine 3-dehydrogenase